MVEEFFICKTEDRNIKAYLSQKEDRLSHNPTQLSKSLSFQYRENAILFEDIHKISSNVTILNGAEDKKYVKMGLEMSALNKNIKHCIVPNCGHNIHIEI